MERTIREPQNNRAEEVCEALDEYLIHRYDVFICLLCQCDITMPGGRRQVALMREELKLKMERLLDLDKAIEVVKKALGTGGDSNAKNTPQVAKKRDRGSENQLRRVHELRVH